ncbi:hypothetical protein AVEN_121751-1 [Araneus ventricosus]|uniref:Uncharacterized protein n=1 Tax=Araneus ventricosus TaxID=182803 RepID=A0A4Y2THS0_ARAVE|nr:hypothetical protein AVEN_121751-1 [Araneus ventricosus]
MDTAGVIRIGSKEKPRPDVSSCKDINLKSAILHGGSEISTLIFLHNKESSLLTRVLQLWILQYVNDAFLLLSGNKKLLEDCKTFLSTRRSAYNFEMCLGQSQKLNSKHSLAVLKQCFRTTQSNAIRTMILTILDFISHFTLLYIKRLD